VNQDGTVVEVFHGSWEPICAGRQSPTTACRPPARSREIRAMSSQLSRPFRFTVACGSGPASGSDGQRPRPRRAVLSGVVTPPRRGRNR